MFRIRRGRELTWIKRKTKKKIADSAMTLVAASHGAKP